VYSQIIELEMDRKQYSRYLSNCMAKSKYNKTTSLNNNTQRKENSQKISRILTLTISVLSRLNG